MLTNWSLHHWKQENLPKLRESHQRCLKGTETRGEYELALAMEMAFVLPTLTREEETKSGPCLNTLAALRWALSSLVGLEENRECSRGFRFHEKDASSRSAAAPRRFSQ